MKKDVERPVKRTMPKDTSWYVKRPSERVNHFDLVESEKGFQRRLMKCIIENLK